MRSLILFVVALLLGATPAAAATPWVLEFGPYAGYYDFDSLTDLQDRALFGARAAVHAGEHALVEVEFDEVYTRREVSEHNARQVSLALHLRIEPGPWRVVPSLLVGAAFVGLDDSDDPDAFGDALDFGIGARYRASSRWLVRAEWLLRRQQYRLYELDAETGAAVPLQSDAEILWGRGFRVGLSYVF